MLMRIPLLSTKRDTRLITLRGTRLTENMVTENMVMENMVTKNMLSMAMESMEGMLMDLKATESTTKATKSTTITHLIRKLLALRAFSWVELLRR
jgi:hypothetical protein